jgi:phosphorylcholine metabolism protein LicD
MLKDISTSFKKHNLNDWWLDGGSLLGHVRHNGFIPHDDDIDIAMLSNTENDSKLKLCTDELSSKYTIQNTISCINIIDPMTNAAVDIFSYTDNGKELKPNLVSLLQWPNAFYIKDKTFPLKHVLFEGSDVHIPSDPITYCYQMYGKDALTTYKCNHLHKTTTFWEEICIYVVKDIPILITQP